MDETIEIYTDFMENYLPYINEAICSECIDNNIGAKERLIELTNWDNWDIFIDFNQSELIDIIGEFYGAGIAVKFSTTTTSLYAEITIKEKNAVVSHFGLQYRDL